MAAPKRRLGVSESEFLRAVRGEPISEPTRAELERTFLVPLRLALAGSPEPGRVERADRQPFCPGARSLSECTDPDTIWQSAERYYLGSDFRSAILWLRRYAKVCAGQDHRAVARARIKIASCIQFVDPAAGAVRTEPLLRLTVAELERSAKTPELADAYNAIADAKLTGGDPDGAAKYYGKAYAVADGLHPILAGNAQYGLARVARARGKVDIRQIDGAREIPIKRATELYGHGASDIGRGNCGYLDALAFLAAHEYQEAGKWLERAASSFARVDNELGQALCHEILGDLFAARDLPVEAIDHRRAAWEHYCRSERAAALHPWPARDRFELTLIRAGYYRSLIPQR